MAPSKTVHLCCPAGIVFLVAISSLNKQHCLGPLVVANTRLVCCSNLVNLSVSGADISNFTKRMFIQNLSQQELVPTFLSSDKLLLLAAVSFFFFCFRAHT